MFLEVNCLEDASALEDGSAEADSRACRVQNKWMKRPVIEAFEAKLAALEQEKE